jgi:membrane protease YdiL (CAAX protease family)
LERTTRTIALESAVILLLMAVPLLVALASTRFRGWAWIAWFACLYPLTDAALSSPALGAFRDFDWNWQGKLVSIFATLVFLVACRSLSFEEVGLTSRLKPGWWKAVVAFLVVAVGLWARRSGVLHWPNRETFAYQATMPGIDEEILVRGVFLAIFTRAFGQWRTGRTTSFGWPALLTSLLFGFLHVAGVSSTGVAFYWSQMTAAGVGLALWYVRERTGSVWPAVVLHNVYNLLVTAG